MISHESHYGRNYAAQRRSSGVSNSHSHYGGHGQHGHGQHSPKTPVNEDTLKTEKVQIERKTFVFTLKENPRGRFLRITEDVNGRRDTIIIPSTGLADFKRTLEAMVEESDKAAPQEPAAES